MLNVSDSGSGVSYKYVRKNIGRFFRRRVNTSFVLSINEPLERDIVITMFRSRNKKPLAGIVLGPENEIKLRAWHYSYYMSDRFYPGKGVYLKSNTGGYLPSFPPMNLHNVQPRDRTILKGQGGDIRIIMQTFTSRKGTAEVNLYAEKIGGRSGASFAGPLNWNRNNVSLLDVGCVYSNETAYDLSFDQLLAEGDLIDENWFSVKDYQGLYYDGPNSLWKGANITTDPSTHTNYTKLKNLTRYNYVSPQDPISVVLVDWGSDYNFQEEGDTLFSEEQPLPHGIKWLLHP